MRGGGGGGQGAGVEAEAWRRNDRGFETPVYEAVGKGEVGELAVFNARGVGSAGFENGFGGRFDGDDLAAAGSDFGEELVDKALWD